MHTQIEAMKRQQEIQAQAQLAFKTGNRKEAERLLAKIKPNPRGNRLDWPDRQAWLD